MLPPSSLLPGLYERVGSSEAFKKTKPFADAVLQAAPEAILAHFADEPPETEADLVTFVNRWFELPSDALPRSGMHEALTLRAHIEARWHDATIDTTSMSQQASIIPMPGRFITSGGMWREQYYWNTYFLMIGLGQDRANLKTEMVGNIADLIERFGHAPNANRTYYLSRSQPPLFFKMVGLLNPGDPKAAFARHLPQLMREHAYWMSGEADLEPGQAHRHAVMMPDRSVLNRYWDDSDTPRDEAWFRDLSIAAAASRPAQDVFRDIRAGAESGWDYSSRWFADGMTMASIATTSIIPVDLNSFLYGLELAIAAGSDRVGDQQGAKAFTQKAGIRSAAMNRWLWNEASGVFDDFDWENGSLRNAISAAALAPLFVGLATRDQAERTAQCLEANLLVQGGLTCTDRKTGEQWDAPYGFAALQWMAVEGLDAYGLSGLAETIAKRWLTTVADVYAQTGRLVEKYDLIEGRAGGGGGYSLQSGQGWTASVTVALLDRYPRFRHLGEVLADQTTG